MAQDHVEQLFNNHEYNEVITLLIKKSKDTILTSDEYNNLILSYTRTQQHSNSLIYSNKMIEYCEENFDTTYLVKALNRKAEALIDLSKIEEGLAFSEEKSKVFREQDSLRCFNYFVLNGECFITITTNTKKRIVLIKKLQQKSIEIRLFSTITSLLQIWA